MPAVLCTKRCHVLRKTLVPTASARSVSWTTTREMKSVEYRLPELDPGKNSVLSLELRQVYIYRPSTGQEFLRKRLPVCGSVDLTKSHRHTPSPPAVLQGTWHPAKNSPTDGRGKGVKPAFSPSQFAAWFLETSFTRTRGQGANYPAFTWRLNQFRFKKETRMRV